MESYSAIKMNEIFPFIITWMDFEVIMLSECQMEKDKYCTVSLVYRIFKKQQQ